MLCLRGNKFVQCNELDLVVEASVKKICMKMRCNEVWGWKCIQTNIGNEQPNISLRSYSDSAKEERLYHCINRNKESHGLYYVLNRTQKWKQGQPYTWLVTWFMTRNIQGAKEIWK